MAYGWLWIDCVGKNKPKVKCQQILNLPYLMRHFVMLKKVFYLSVAVFTIGINIPVNAAIGSTNIGYVNIEQALTMELDAQKSFQELEKEEQEILNGEQKASAEFEKKFADYQKSLPKLSDKAKIEQQKVLTDEYQSLQAKFTQKRKDVMEKRQRIIGDLENKNRLLLESLARKKKYDIIFNSQALFYVSDELKKHDITPELVKSFNEAYPPKGDTKKTPVNKTDKKK
jgi:outer membrane protein